MISLYAAPGITGFEKNWWKELKDLQLEKAHEIMYKIANHYGVEYQLLKSSTRKMQVVKARHISIYLIHKKTKLYYTEIGRLFNRDHSTIIDTKQVIEGRIQVDKHFAQEYKIAEMLV